MPEYRIPPFSVWTEGLADHHIVRVLPDFTALDDVIGSICRRQYGSESSRFSAVLRRYFGTDEEAEPLILLTQGRGLKPVRMGKHESVAVAADVVELNFASPNQLGAPAGSRARSDRLTRYTGTLALRFYFHHGSERDRSASLVATSEFVSVEVLIPEEETQKRPDAGYSWRFTRGYPEGVAESSASLDELLGEDAGESDHQPRGRRNEAGSGPHQPARPRSPFAVSVRIGYGQEPELPAQSVPFDEGVQLWDSSGELAALLRRGGSGSTATVVLLRPGHSTTVDQYQVHNDDGRIVWTSTPSGVPVEPPVDAVEGAWFATGPDGTALSPEETPAEPPPPKWYRAEEFPHELLVSGSDEHWHYLVDDEGDIVLGREEVALSALSGRAPRAAGEFSWAGEARSWRLSEPRWYLDEQARAELRNDSDSPHRWVRNIADRLEELLGMPFDRNRGPTVHPADLALPSELADLDDWSWNTEASSEVHRVIETLTSAGPGAHGLIVVFRPGRDKVERYQVLNHGGRMVWRSDSSGQAAEPPWDALAGTSSLWTPDGRPLKSISPH